MIVDYAKTLRRAGGSMVIQTSDQSVLATMELAGFGRVAGLAATRTEALDVVSGRAPDKI